MKALLTLLLLAAASAAQTRSPSPAAQQPPASATQAMYQQAAASAERKFEHLQRNAQQAHPDQTPTQFTEREINAYLSSGRVQLPKGVQRAQFTGTPGNITADARVDFDAITANRKSANPLLSLFSGTHDVEIKAHGSGSGGQARTHIDSVSIDGVSVPRIALEFFIDHYLTPKYPQASLDPVFTMPARIDTAAVGMHTLTVTQK